MTPFPCRFRPSARHAAAFAVLALVAAFAPPARAACGEAPKPAAPAAPAPAAAAHPRHIDSLAWLVDGVWTADATRMAPGLQRIETRYRWSDNGSFIRFTTHFVTTQTEMRTYDGQFFWDPEPATLAMWYMDRGNTITRGPVTVDGDAIDMRFHGPDFAGKPADLRVVVTRLTPDKYRWTVSEQADGAWKELATLDYVRSAGS